jgi:hypothetical protein
LQKYDVSGSFSVGEDRQLEELLEDYHDDNDAILESAVVNPETGTNVVCDMKF